MVVKRHAGLLLSGTVLASVLRGGAGVRAGCPDRSNAAADQCVAKAIADAAKPGNGDEAAGQRPRSRRTDAQQSAQTAQQSVQNIPPGLYNADVPVPTKGPPSWFGGIHISLAGTFIAMEGAWRQHNEISSGASDPPFSTHAVSQLAALFRERERFSAQQSRLAIEGLGRHRPGAAFDRPTTKMTGWAPASPRIRARATAITCACAKPGCRYDNDNWHFHFLRRSGVEHADREQARHAARH